MRMTVSRGSMNLSQKDGGLPPDSVVQDEETILADSERVLKLFHDPKPGAQIRVALAPCSPFSISKDLMTESARLAERYDCQLHTHLCETEDEERFCLKMYGLRPVDLLEETGWMSSRAWLAHGIHFNAEEIARLGKARRRRLPLRGLEHGAGVGDLPDLRARGGGLVARPRRRRLGLQRFLQHDGGGPPCADDRPPALRRRTRSPIATSCAGRRKGRRAASGAPTSAGSRRAMKRTSRCSSSTSRASRARTIRSPRSSSAAPTAPIG